MLLLLRANCRAQVQHPVGLPLIAVLVQHQTLFLLSPAANVQGDMCSVPPKLFWVFLIIKSRGHFMPVIPVSEKHTPLPYTEPASSVRGGVYGCTPLLY